MDNYVSLSESTDEHHNSWNNIIRAAIFSDLIILREYDPRVFSELFYGRTNSIREFSGFVDNVTRSGSNVIVTGDAGIGKSTFMYKLFLDEENELGDSVFSIFLDFRQSFGSIEAAYLKLIDGLDQYFITINSPIHTLKAIENPLNAAFNLGKISNHLSGISKDDMIPPVLLLVDDLDYADEDWLEFLMQIQNLVLSPKISLVLSMRPPLEFMIKSANDVLYRDLVRSSKRIHLPELSVDRVLYQRLAPIIKRNEKKSFYRYIQNLFERDSALCSILRTKYEVANLEELERFEYPFTERLLNFMSEITNGNIREVFDIAETCLRYIFKNSKNLEERLEDGETKYILSHEVIMELFYTERDKWGSNFEIFNVHEVRSEAGNSLHYNILESVKLKGSFDRNLYNKLKVFGHDNIEVDQSLGVLEDRNHRLIIPLKTNKHLQGTRKMVMATEYGISKKGEKYLEMAKFWTPYKELFGNIGRSMEEIL